MLYIIKNNENQTKIGISGVYKNILIIIYIFPQNEMEKISWEILLVFKNTHHLSFKRVKKYISYTKKMKTKENNAFCFLR